MPLAAIGLVVLWRHGIRDGMFVYAVIAVVAPLATGSAMSLPRFLMGTFPYAVAGGILLDRLDPRLRTASSRSAPPGSWPACGRPTAAAGLRRNLAIALAVAALHAGAALAYHGDGKDLPATYFYPRAHAVAHGTDAYGGLDYEYPPATLPLLVAPLAAGGDDSGQAYHQRTIWLYGALDVGLRPAARRHCCGAGRAGARRWRSRSTASACSCSGGWRSRASTSWRASRSCWPGIARAIRDAPGPGSASPAR